MENPVLIFECHNNRVKYSGGLNCEHNFAWTRLRVRNLVQFHRFIGPVKLPGFHVSPFVARYFRLGKFYARTEGFGPLLSRLTRIFYPDVLAFSPSMSYFRHDELFLRENATSSASRVANFHSSHT